MFQRTRFEVAPINFADAHFFAEFSAEEASFGTKKRNCGFRSRSIRRYGRFPLKSSLQPLM